MCMYICILPENDMDVTWVIWATRVCMARNPLKPWDVSTFKS